MLGFVGFQRNGNCLLHQVLGIDVQTQVTGLGAVNDISLQCIEHLGCLPTRTGLGTNSAVVCTPCNTCQVACYEHVFVPAVCHHELRQAEECPLVGCYGNVDVRIGILGNERRIADDRYVTRVLYQSVLPLNEVSVCVVLSVQLNLFAPGNSLFGCILVIYNRYLKIQQLVSVGGCIVVLALGYSVKLGIPTAPCIYSALGFLASRSLPFVLRHCAVRQSISVQDSLTVPIEERYGVTVRSGIPHCNICLRTGNRTYLRIPSDKGVREFVRCIFHRCLRYSNFVSVEVVAFA